MLVNFLQLTHTEELERLELWLQIGRESIPILGKGFQKILFEVHPIPGGSSLHISCVAARCTGLVRHEFVWYFTYWKLEELPIQRDAHSSEVQHCFASWAEAFEAFKEEAIKRLA